MSESSSAPQKKRRASVKNYTDEDKSIYGIDLFLRCLYDYWLHGGLSFLIARKVTRLLKTLTVFSILIIVFYCIDYSALVSASEKSLVTQSIIHMPEMTWVVWIWLCGSSIYFLYNVWKTINQIQQARNIHQFYRTNLHINSDEMLAATPWHVVCQLLRTFQYQKWLAEKKMRPIRSTASFTEDQEAFEPLHNSGGSDNNAMRDPMMAQFTYEAMLTDDNIATMIMRRENYWIAMFADNILTFKNETVPFATSEDISEDETEDADSQGSSEKCESERGESEKDEASLDGEFEFHFKKTLKNTLSPERDLEQGEYPPEEKKAPNPFYVGYPLSANGSTMQRVFQRTKNWFVNVILKPLFITECDRHGSDKILEKPILTKTLQWCLTYGLFGFAIDSQTGALKHELTLFIQGDRTFAEREQKRSNSAFRSASEWHRTSVSQPLINKLIWRFRAMAIVGALLSPFIFMLVLLSFFFEHGDEVRNEPGRSLGTRQWTNEARWAFRKYNELPHHFEARLARGALAAEHYVNSFYFATQGEIARCAAFIAAATLFIFLIIGAFGDEVALSNIHFALDRSAFWWITSLSLLIAAARSLAPSIETERRETLRRHDTDIEENDDDEEQKNSTKRTIEQIFDSVQNEFLQTPKPVELCQLVAQFTGYYPRSWHGREQTEAVRQRFSCLFDSKWIIYLREIAGIIYTPYLLWFVFPEKAQQFLNFFVERTERQHKVGHVCARENIAENLLS